ncbi:MAG: purine-nucleoside phosphorylase [FCB group bacterium]|jgi:purine-nucleoside phosphorylase|nr:purine-nucleoside phosphorylase [FCB group bacterium]
MPRPVAVVAGSGIDLRTLFTRIDGVTSFDEIPGLSAAGVPGHSGQFIAGWCGPIPVILQSGRRHVYEGCDIESVMRTVDALRAFGAETVVFTNAAGGLLPAQEPGSLMSVDRVLTWPCKAWSGQPASIAVDTLVPGCDCSGAYIWMHGPSYETRAEIQALLRIGAGAVGMSTAPEMLRAKELGLRTAAVSCITNSCLAPQVLTHGHVLDTAGRASSRLVGVLKGAMPALGGE